MLEVGRIMVNGKMDFNWNRAHFGAWCVVSAPLILGFKTNPNPYPISNPHRIVLGLDVTQSLNLTLILTPTLTLTLTLGLDVTQPGLLEPVIPIVTNHEAIAINQEWAGHPGALVWTAEGGAMGYPGARQLNNNHNHNLNLKSNSPILNGFSILRKCNLANKALKQSGWSLAALSQGAGFQVKAPQGGCLTLAGAGYPGGAGGLAVTPCNSTTPLQQFKYDAGTKQLVSTSSGHCVDIHSGGPIVWMYGCSATSANDLFSFSPSNGTLEAAGICVGVESEDPAGSTYQSQLQAWAKPLNGSVAVLMINPDPTIAHDFNVPLSLLPFPKDLQVHVHGIVLNRALLVGLGLSIS